MGGEPGLGTRNSASTALAAFAPVATPIILLEVTDGLHAGAQLALDGEFHSIGSNVESDIVLRDEGVAPSHARLRLSGSSVEIEAFGGDVLLDKGVVPQGHGQKCRLPLNARIGGAMVRIRHQQHDAERSFLSRTLALTLIGLVGVFVLSVVANQLSMADTKHVSKALAAALPAAGTEASATAAGDRSVTAATRDLTQKIEEAGIGPLDIHVDDGRISVAGTVPRDRSQAWANVQAWFDQTHGAKFMLASTVAVASAEAAPQLALQAIWYGNRPYIITADGARYHEGAFVENGWSIKRIGEDALILGKDGATIALRYP
ncbi:FHA domain-containing protein [Mesorhizobium sp. AaZ16]|uniref:SctD/MshK family protein n=1 Tax=Mesorhizobium sp. AaZ16 TaxID=3402289 RepID=UPI00374ECDFE